MLLRIMAILFGIGFIFAGAAGFFPEFMRDGLLLGIFQVDTMHNVFHLVSGVVAIMAATSYRYTKLYFQIFGVIYALITIIGFFWKGDMGFMMMPMNMADNILHLVITLIALYLGFFHDMVRNKHY
jgi:hypothetical protein